MVADKAEREHSPVVEQLKKDVASVKMKASEQNGTLTASLEQDKKEVVELKKEKDAALQESGDVRYGTEHAEYKRDKLQAKLQRARPERK